MQIEIHLKPGSKQNSVKKVSDNIYMVSTKEKPIENRANLALINLLSDYLNVPRSSMKIVSGIKSKLKRAEIAE